MRLKFSHGVLAVAFLSIAVCSVVFPEPDRLVLQYGARRWSCAEMVPNKSRSVHVGWIAARGGVSFLISSSSEISYMRLSCLIGQDSRSCDSRKGRWGAVVTKIRVGSSWQTISFERRTSGVDGSWFMDAHLSGAIGASAISAFARGSQALVTVKGESGEAFYEQTVNLDGFNEAMKQCGYFDAATGR